MTQKQMLGAVVGVVAVVVLGTLVYKQFVGDDVKESASLQSTKRETTSNQVMMKQEAQPVPETIEGITESISEESSTDLSAFDEEGAGEASELDEDAESVNNLENSYDENNL